MKFVLLVALFASLCLAYNEGEEIKWYPCTMSGDPHFRSFDGASFDYQGVGWYDLVRHPNLKISAEFTACGGGKVSCTTNAYLWTNQCGGTGTCPTVEFMLKDSKHSNKATAKINGNDILTLPTSAGPLGSSDIIVSYTGNTLNLRGCLNGCALQWTAQFRSGSIFVQLQKPGSSAETQWQSVQGLCGTPDGNAANEYVVGTNTYADSTVSWRTIIPQLTQFGDALATSGSNKANLEAYLSTAVTATPQAMYTLAQLDEITGCVYPGATTPPVWKDAAGQTLCTDVVEPICRNEHDKAQCMTDYSRAYASTNNQDDYNTLASEWSTQRAQAAAFWTGSVGAGSSVMLGLFIGLGVGLVFVVAAVAFFAKNPELLPFTHKKKKIQKELASTDVLK